MRAFIMTGDESIRSWGEATFETHQREAESVDIGVLTP